jgi:hypothetical protein
MATCLTTSDGYSVTTSMQSSHTPNVALLKSVCSCIATTKDEAQRVIGWEVSHDRLDVVAGEGAKVVCTFTESDVPAIVTLLHHLHHVTLMQAQLIRVLRFIAKHGLVPVCTVTHTRYTCCVTRTIHTHTLCHTHHTHTHVVSHAPHTHTLCHTRTIHTHTHTRCVTRTIHTHTRTIHTHTLCHTHHTHTHTLCHMHHTHTHVVSHTHHTHTTRCTSHNITLYSHRVLGLRRGQLLTGSLQSIAERVGLVRGL